MRDTGCDLYQFQSDRIHLHFTHGLWKHQSPEPVKEVVGEAMQLKPIGIHNHGGRTDRAKVETVLSFFDEVFHSSAVAVEADDIPDRKIHVGHNECVQVIHLAMRLLNLHCNTARLTPGASLVIKFAVDSCVINGIVFGSVEQDFIKVRSQFTQRAGSSIFRSQYPVFKVRRVALGPRGPLRREK